MATAPAMLSEDILRDVVELQGKEIARLRAQLTTAEERIRALEQGKSSLQPSNASQADRKPHWAKGPQNSSNESREPGTAGNTMDIPFYPPSYNGELLHSFGQGKRARQRFTEIRGSSLPGLRIKQGDLIPEEGCELVCILKPLMRMTKRGGMSSSGPSKQKYHRANEVAVKLGVNWYYLGRYRCAKEDNLDASGYHALSSGAKQALVQSCGPKKHHTTIEAKLWSGDIAVRRYHLRREGFNEDLYRRLLDAAAGGKLDVADGGAELGSDGADESGDADE